MIFNDCAILPACIIWYGYMYIIRYVFLDSVENIPFAPLPPSQRQYKMRNVNPKTI